MKKAPKGTKMRPGKRGLYTPASEQAVVLAKSLAGMSQREIAETENLHRRTVKRILSQEEFKQALGESRSRFFGLIPKALAIYERELDSRKRTKEQISIARHVLDGTRVTIPRSEQVHHPSFEEEADKRTTAELQFAAKQGRWPTDEEMIHYAETGRWPQDETKQ